MSRAAVGSSPGLERAVSRWEIVGLALNDVVGSGVYLLPAAAALMLGAASLWAVVAAGAAVLLVVLCFAEAGSHFDGPGSAYLYARTAFGNFVGFEVGWMTWLARVASVASLSAGFAQALTYLWPAAGAGGGRVLTIVVSLLALTLINVVGVRSGARTAVLLAVCKIVPLLVFVGVGVFIASAARVLKTPAGNGNLGEAALLLLYAYAGFENTAAPAGEFKNPRRDVPFALIAQIVIVTLLYTAVQWVALGTLPDLAHSQTPIADAARLFLGSWGGLLLTVGGALSILGTNSNTVLTGPRYLFALAEDGFGPRGLAAVHPRFHTPAVAILVQSAIALPLALTGSFAGLAALSVVARLASYLGTAAAVPVLRKKLGRDQQTLLLPGGPVIPIAAFLVCLAFVASATITNLVAGALALLAGLPIYLLRRRKG
ncbi:MAG TPA: APC family permease [Thermoanaerobaculia bacterium]|nr:APC family permease [Thermoanaerobaculia bacterium]